MTDRVVTWIRSGALKLDARLGKPGWHGYGTVVSVLTLFATIAVAILVERLAAARESQAVALTRANISVNAVLVNEENSNRWWLEIYLGNNGPATADEFRIELILGGYGVAAPQAPISNGVELVDSGGAVFVQPPGGPWYSVFRVMGRTEDRLLPGDSVQIAMALSLHPEVQALVSADQNFQAGGEGFYQGSFGEREGTMFVASGGGRSIIGVFLGWLEVRGNNTSRLFEWEPNISELPRSGVREAFRPDLAERSAESDAGMDTWIVVLLGIIAGSAAYIVVGLAQRRLHRTVTGFAAASAARFVVRASLYFRKHRLR